MTPLLMRGIRALVIALMLVALSTSFAAADEGSGIDVVPYDPGLPGEEAPPPPPPPWAFSEY